MRLSRVAPLLALVSFSAAHAALPAGIETAVTAAQTDGLTLVGLMAGMGAAVFLIVRVLRRFGIIA